MDELLPQSPYTNLCSRCHRSKEYQYCDLCSICTENDFAWVDEVLPEEKMRKKR
jgi:hypothetical protein